jgi:hypothetical protein
VRESRVIAVIADIYKSDVGLSRNVEQTPASLGTHKRQSANDEKMFTVARSSRTVCSYISESIFLLLILLLMLLQSLRANVFRALARGVSTYDTIVIGGG